MCAAPVKLASSEVAEAAKKAGCRVISRSTFNDGETTWPIVEIDCGDNLHAIKFLNEAAAHDTTSPDVREIALRLRAAHVDPIAFLRAVQCFVKASVRFVREVRETFQHTLYTLRHRAGDCDDHARAVVALALAGGQRGRVVGIRNARGDVSHVAPLVFDGKGWHWAETTVDARFGEHPRAAARRLGLAARPDIWHVRRKEATRAAQR